MRNTAPLSLRTAGAAIAAVLALPATSVFAQDVAPTTVAPSAPAPVISLPQPTPPPPAPVLVIPAQPSAPVAEVPVAETATPAARPTRVTAPRAAARPAAVIRSAAPVATPAAEPVVETTAAEVAPPADIEFAPVQAAEPVGTVASVPTVASVAPVDDGNGLSAGELGLMGGALAIGGIAAAAMLSRRRRRPDAEPIDVFAVSTASAPPRAADPVNATTRATASVSSLVAQPFVAQTSRPTADFPATASIATPFVARRPAAGQKLVGRHEARVDDGPTADNPFVTRRNRLRRARFLDRQEAQASGAQQQGSDWMDDYRRQYRTVGAH